MDPKRCSRCKIESDRSLFISVKGIELKTCQKCREYGVNCKCPHGIKRSRCKECVKTCPHGKRESRCAICDGKSLCRGHKKIACKECGLGVCLHGGLKRSCMICQACVHGKQKYYCVECGGKGLCECGNRRYHCKKCGGAGICVAHGKQKTSCKECIGSSSICEHNKQRYFCKECHGKAYCGHGTQWRKCIECRGIDAIAFSMYYRCKSSDSFRDREFDLDQDFLKSLIEASTDCYYCGEELNYRSRRKEDGATIERLDNTIGHTKDNCVIACWKCNLKHGKARFHEDYTPEEPQSPESS